MARMPGAVWVGEQSPRILMTKQRKVCVHTIVGWAPAHAAHFSTKFDGTILQSRDTIYRSGANLDGNDNVIAIENEDGAKDIPLTDEQVEANARILKWCNEAHGVPLAYCPDSKEESEGLAVHRQGITGNFTMPADDLGLPRSMWMGLVPGGESWTLSPGKICPLNKRIAQVPLILELAKNGGDMALSKEDKAWMRDMVREAAANGVWSEQRGGSVKTAWQLLLDSADEPTLNEIADAVAAKVVASLPPSGGGDGATPAEVYTRCKKAVTDVLARTQPADPTA